MKSFDAILKELTPTVWMLQETKLRPNEQILCASVDDYQVYYLNRQKLEGGGIAIGVNKNTESTLINEGEDDIEILSVKIQIDGTQVRTITAYAPQENAVKDKKDRFWEFLEKEINDAEIEEEGLILQMDGNLHAGPDLLKKDPNKQNQNGRIFMEFLDRNSQLTVVNTLSMCEGLITRSRNVENKKEEAVLDFFVVNEKMLPFIKKMIVDENKLFGLINLAQIKKNKQWVESDHNALVLEMELNEGKEKVKREEILNFRNRVCQEAFKKETENNKDLLECFKNNSSIDVQFDHWKQIFDDILNRCFKKIRITPKKSKTKIEELLKERVKLKKEAREIRMDENMVDEITKKIKDIENDIGEDVAHENYKAVVETSRNISEKGDINGSGRTKMWSMLKKKFPKTSKQNPIAKRDKRGNLVTKHEDLKKLYLKTYKLRMRNRPMKQELLDLKIMKENLFAKRLKLAEERKSEFWNMNDLELALKALKDNKSRDPNGWINELFKDGVAGYNLKLSLLLIFNKIKDENQIPEFIRLADVSTIYKGKGSKKELVNERGIFVVSIMRSILMRLIYADYYSILDQSMSDSQIGSRRGKNIRNHLWIVHGVISDVLSKKSKKAVDVQIFDYKQCFDSLWLQECLNDFYSAGVQDDKLALLYNINANVNIAIRTPVGKTTRENIHNVITQGDVFGPLLCSKLVDTIGQECLNKKKHIYLYRGEVEIPPLSMVDDLLCISECGYKTASAHAYLSFKTDSKKLQFGAQKCKKLHVGKNFEDYKCQTLKIQNWNELEVVDEETGMDVIEDICSDALEMEQKMEDKYLGDIISVDGRNIKNIKARVSKGKGINSRILSILDGIPFGQYHFEVAMILRNSLLVSSMLCNSESWYNITKAEMSLLESVDLQFLRSVLKVPKSTPKEMLYLELGCLPFRYLIKKRRILFLHYILNEKQDSMLNRFLMTQINNRKKRDWIDQVFQDLNELNLGDNLNKIKMEKKGNLKHILDKKIRQNAFEDLNNQKKNHSKVMHLEHKNFEMQKYLKQCNIKITQEEAQEIFKLRSRVSNVKINYKGKYDTYECEACKHIKPEEESQKHVINCKILNEDKDKVPEYEEIFYGNTHMKLKIAKHFLENIKTREKLEKIKN